MLFDHLTHCGQAGRDPRGRHPDACGLAMPCCPCCALAADAATDLMSLSSASRRGIPLAPIPLHPCTACADLGPYANAMRIARRMGNPDASDPGMHPDHCSAAAERRDGVPRWTREFVGIAHLAAPTLDPADVHDALLHLEKPRGDVRPDMRLVPAAWMDRQAHGRRVLPQATLDESIRATVAAALDSPYSSPPSREANALAAAGVLPSKAERLLRLVVVNGRLGPQFPEAALAVCSREALDFDKVQQSVSPPLEFIKAFGRRWATSGVSPAELVLAALFAKQKHTAALALLRRLAEVQLGGDTGVTVAHVLNARLVGLLCVTVVDCRA